MFDVEAALIAWLPDKVGVPCYADVPKDRPSEFVTVERTGGEAGLGADRPNLAVQAWAETRLDASNLAAKVKDALILDSWEIAEVCKCSVTSVYNFADPSSRMARYQIDVSMVTRL